MHNEVNKKWHRFIVVVIALLPVSGCEQENPDVSEFQEQISCEMSELEVLALSNKLGADILQVNSGSEMIQVRFPPDEFLVYFDEGRNVKHADRARIESMFFGLVVENAGFYELLHCLGARQN